MQTVFRNSFQRLKWYTAILIGIAAITVMLNHTSFDIGYYTPESQHQQAQIERGTLRKFGSFVFRLDVDGSVVHPDGLANDLRTWAIDAIIATQAVMLIVMIKKYYTK